METTIIVLGGINTDYMIRGAALPHAGETRDGEGFEEGPGGKGANQAIAAARLGATVAMIGCVGTESRADRAIAALEASGVSTLNVKRNAGAPTGVALIMVGGNGEKQIMVSPGANRKLTIADVQQAAGVIHQARVLLCQLETPTECVMEAMQIANKSGVRVVLDTAPASSLPQQIYPLIYCIRSNSAEASALTGIQVHDVDSARAAAKEYLRRGVQAAVVQAGSQGNLYVWDDGECMLPLLMVRSIDATGAGDALSAALAVSLADGLTLAEAGPFANAAAALATTVLGAQAGLPKREGVVELMSSLNITS